MSYPTPWAKALTANTTSASFASIVPTLTTPSGTGVVAWPHHANLMLLAYGVGANNTTVGLRGWGWKSTTNSLWVPTLLVNVASATLSQSPVVGVATADVLDTESFADVSFASNVIADSDTVSRNESASGATDVAPAALHLKTMMQPWDLIQFDAKVGTATSANLLWCSW